MSTNILLIDDEVKLRSLLKRIISLEGYHVFDTGTLSSGLKLLESESIDIVLCDVKLTDGNGVDFTKTIKEKYPQKEVILLTAYGNIPDGVQAIKNGAFDYIVKGDDNDKIIPLLSRAVEKVALQKKVCQLEQRLNTRYGFESITGSSPAILASINLARKVAPTDAPVLLTGETGTGKEVFAQAIHFASARSNQPFVAFNCSALSKDLMESELFGHKAGAFTGAAKDKKGLIEEAKGGTLFLDEIGEMPMELQPKLLRFLENGTYYRVGDATQRTAEVRLVAATNRDLQKEIDNGHFRSDLYYRIAVFSIPLPSLRERQKDIVLLANHYLQVYALKTNKQIGSITKEAAEVLSHYSWPGNVRELKNVIERAVILEDGSSLTQNSLPFELLQSAMSSGDNGATAFHLATVEKLHIQKVLRHTNGNKAEAARLMDIGLATLYRKIEEYGMK
jgi:two-component system, NtrC family, response regulator